MEDPALAYRFQLPPVQAELIFQATADSIVGPVAGNGISLIRVDEFLPAEKDEVVRTLLEAVDEWLAAKLCDFTIDFVACAPA